MPDPTTKSINQTYYGSQSTGRLEYWKRMAAPRFRVQTFLHLLEGMPAHLSLVDLGCGNGELLREIRASHPDYTLCGIDLSSAQIEVNRCEDPSIDWRVMDLDHLQGCPDDLSNRFDVVVASEIIEHVEKPEHLLRNALVLAKSRGGGLLVSTQSGRVGETEKRVGHRRHFSAAEMNELLSSAGWTPARIWNAGYPFHDWSKRIANIRPDSAMKTFGDGPYGFPHRMVCLALRLAFHLNSNQKGAQLFAVAKRT